MILKHLKFVLARQETKYFFLNLGQKYTNECSLSNKNIILQFLVWKKGKIDHSIHVHIIYPVEVQCIKDVQEEFENTKGVIRIRKSKKDRQDIVNGQKKKDKRTNNDLQNTT